MRDRTDMVRAAVEQYDAFDFIPLRIECAFDVQWWDRVGGRLDYLGLVADISSEGNHGYWSFRLSRTEIMLV
jgi:cytoplasmic tRNA 2-thiolation protein 2